MMALLRFPAVIDRAGLSRSSLYSRVSQGLWPPPIKLGQRASAWPEHEISALNAARVSGKSDAQIRDLVAELIAARKSCVSA